METVNFSLLNINATNLQAIKHSHNIVGRTQNCWVPYRIYRAGIFLPHPGPRNQDQNLTSLSGWKEIKIKSKIHRKAGGKCKKSKKIE